MALNTEGECSKLLGPKLKDFLENIKGPPGQYCCQRLGQQNKIQRNSDPSRKF